MDSGAGVCRSAVEINFQVHLEQLDDLGERGMAPCMCGISVFFILFFCFQKFKSNKSRLTPTLIGLFFALSKASQR